MCYCGTSGRAAFYTESSHDIAFHDASPYDSVESCTVRVVGEKEKPIEGGSGKRDFDNL